MQPALVELLLAWDESNCTWSSAGLSGEAFSCKVAANLKEGQRLSCCCNKCGQISKTGLTVMAFEQFPIERRSSKPFYS